MGIIQRFGDAVDPASPAHDPGPVGLPIRLTRACVRVLSVTGVGLSLFSAPTMRIPVGASDDTAETAERLEFTVADGPCFTAHRTGRPVNAPDSVIAQRWPLFYDQLVTRTPIRGILATPLPGGLTGLGVLDLYVDRPGDLAGIDQDQVQAVAGYIAQQLTTEPLFPDFRNGPPWQGALWSQNPAARARGNVLMAMGMISVALGLPLDDALAVLFAADRTVDATASDVVHRTLPPTALALDTP